MRLDRTLPKQPAPPEEPRRVPPPSPPAPPERRAGLGGPGMAPPGSEAPEKPEERKKATPQEIEELEPRQHESEELEAGGGFEKVVQRDKPTPEKERMVDDLFRQHRIHLDHDALKSSDQDWQAAFSNRIENVQKKVREVLTGLVEEQLRLIHSHEDASIRVKSVGRILQPEPTGVSFKLGKGIRHVGPR